jgi:hypothetical protein
MKYLFLLGLFLLASNSFGQKAKIKNDIGYIDGKAYCEWVRLNMGNEASVRALNAEQEEIYVAYRNYTDPVEVSKSNPEGKVRWMEVYFPAFDLRCEVENRTHKGLLKLFYQNNLYVDGQLNRENAERFVKKFGMRFSENRRNGNVNIIIKNN